jgi:predicted SAM-dependent methyltransferase
MNLNEFHQNYWKMIELRREPPKAGLLKILSDNKKKKSKNETSGVLFKKVGERASFLDIGAGNKSLRESIIGEPFLGKYKSMDIDKSISHDFYSLEEITGTYDCVYMLNLLEHLQLDMALMYLQKAYDVLREGGVLVIAVPNIDHINHMWKHDITHVRQYPAKDLYAILRLMNFKGSIDIYRIYHRPYYHSIKSKILEILKIQLTKILEVDYTRDIMIIAQK